MSALGMMVAANKWETLQQPAHQSGLEPQCRLLLAALDQGWHVEEPVYWDAQWGERQAQVYQFILRHPLLATLCLLTVPAAPLVETIVCRENWRVLA